MPSRDGPTWTSLKLFPCTEAHLSTERAGAGRGTIGKPILLKKCQPFSAGFNSEPAHLDNAAAGGEGLQWRPAAVPPCMAAGCSTHSSALMDCSLCGLWLCLWVSSQFEERLPVGAAFSPSLICLGFVVGEAEQGTGCGAGWIGSVDSCAETEVNQAGPELISGIKQRRIEHG